MASLYEIPLTTLSDQPASLASHRGHVLLLVNVASKCGFTPQYTGLESLYQSYKDRGLAVLGFPANEFAYQEDPAAIEDIATFCCSVQITFQSASPSSARSPSLALTSIRSTASSSPNASRPPVRRRCLAERTSAGYLKSQNLPGPNDPPELLWNFEKFLIGRDGKVLARFASDVAPDDPRLISAIEQALNAA